MRCETAQPCMGSRDSVRRIRRSSVPWSNSSGGSGIGPRLVVGGLHQDGNAVVVDGQQQRGGRLATGDGCRCVLARTLGVEHPYPMTDTPPSGRSRRDFITLLGTTASAAWIASIWPPALADAAAANGETQAPG